MSEENDDDDEAVEESRVFRMHRVTKIFQPGPGKLMTRMRILVEDEDGSSVRVLVENENQFGGDDTTLHLEDDELLELIRSLELVAKRRGLIDAVRFIGGDGTTR